jgi:MFS family permease
MAGNTEDFEAVVDWNDPFSLRNWITRLNLDCNADSIVLGLFGTYEFAGQLFACIIFPPLADLLGRRIFTFIGLAMQTVVFIGLIAFKKHVWYYSLIFIMGNSVVIRYLIVYAHLMEFVAHKQNLITGIFLFLDGLVYIYSPLILVHIVRSTQYFVWLGLGASLAAIFLLGFIFHMPESLKYSLVKQDIMKFENDMDYICEMNRATDEQREKINYLVEKYCAQVREQQKNQFVQVKEGRGRLIRRLCHDKNAFYNLGLMVVCWVSTNFTYFLVIFLVKYLPGSIYTNSLVSGFSVIGYLVTPPLARKYDNRKIMLVGYAVSLIFLVLMAIV